MKHPKEEHTFWQVRDLGTHTPGISGFPSREIPPSSRWEGYVKGVGTKLFSTREAAETWCKVWCRDALILEDLLDTLAVLWAAD